MSIQIKQVSVKNLGPILEFDQQMKQVNLFYGHNETGKTYLVEFIYRSLFKHLNLSLRDNIASGQVTVSGMGKDDIAFSPSRKLKKLEDFWGEDLPGLPADFSRLLVVKGADLDLASCEQGIDAKILKEFLSGEGLLDKIGTRINATEKNAAYENGVISGSNSGRIKKYFEHKKLLSVIDEQISKINLQISGGRRAQLAARIELLRKEKNEQENAKKNMAFKLDRELTTLKMKLSALPQDQISLLDTKVHDHQGKKGELEEKKQDLEENLVKSQHYSWLEKASDQYDKLVFQEKTQRSQSGLVWMILAGVSLAVSIGLILFKQSYIGVGTIILSAVFSAIYLYMLRRTPVGDVQKAEMEKIEEGFRERFNATGKVGIATLSEKKEELHKFHTTAEVLTGDVKSIKLKLAELEGEIQHLLEKFPDLKVKKGDWIQSVKSLQMERQAIDEERQKKSLNLSRLDISENEYREKAVKTSYDPDSYQGLVKELEETLAEKKQLEDDFDNLKYSVKVLTGENDEKEWEQLIEKLHQKRVDTVKEYKQVTAELIARITVNQALDELREYETSRIDDGLHSDEVNQALFSTTGHYNQVELEHGALVISDKYGRYRLSDLSTGAREQVLLGLRLGFAARLLTGKSLFLILDDAFQHSDWERRQGLVDKLFSLAEEGWQVLYFTMDDHIRDLFEKAGKKIGKNYYQTIEMQG